MTDLSKSVKTPFLLNFSNKFLKHVFNIVFKLNNHTCKKYEISSWFKTMISSLAISHLWKKLQLLEKKFFFQKKFFRFICTYEIFKTVCRNFFKRNRSRDIINFGDFMVLKIVFHSKFINKTWTKKDKKNSA